MRQVNSSKKSIIFEFILHMLVFSLEITSFQYFEAYLTKTELAILTHLILTASLRCDARLEFGPLCDGPHRPKNFHAHPARQ